MIEVDGCPTCGSVLRNSRAASPGWVCSDSWHDRTPETLPNADVTKLEDRPDVKLAIDKAVAAAKLKAYNQIMKNTDRQFPKPVAGSPMKFSRDGQIFNELTAHWEKAVLAALQLKKEPVE